VPAEAAVAEALGTLSVSLAVHNTRSKGTPSSSATICATLVCRPWPISVPPWLTCTLPSSVHMHQGAGLVEQRGGEADAKFDRGDGQAALEHGAAGIPSQNSLLRTSDIALLL
jgi:hypothetical protein